MPIVNGQKVRSRYTALKLGELSGVDRPAQIGARALIMKRAPDDLPAAPSVLALAVAKYVDDDDGAHTFDEVLAENEFDEKVWPMVSALSQSVRSIMGDKAVTGTDREAKIATTVDEFLSAVRAIGPEPAADSEKRLAALISKRKTDMTELEKALAKVAELTGQLTSANALVTAEKARADAAETSLTTEKAAHSETKKALVEATDETLTVGGQEIRKSVVGEGQFSVTKALMGERDAAKVEKRVEAEFAHVAGTTAEKALVLKAAAALDEPTQKALDAILASAENMAAAGFDRLGAGGGPVNEDVRKATGDFATKVAEIKKRDNCTNIEANKRAREENPELFDHLVADAA